MSENNLGDLFHLAKQYGKVIIHWGGLEPSFCSIEIDTYIVKSSYTDGLIATTHHDHKNIEDAMREVIEKAEKLVGKMQDDLIRWSKIKKLDEATK